MKALVKSGKKEYTIDLSKPLDISISLTNGPANLTAWYQEPPEIKAVEMEGFVGDVQRGGSVNFRNVFFNPHAHGTHTECVGHISAEGESVNAALSQFFFTAQLISIPPQVLDNGDHCLTLAQVKEQLPEAMPTAIVVRTLPNNETKTSRQYSRTNPAYVAAEVMQFLVDKGVQHFLIDLPSVDREEDEGELKAHKAFWEFNGKRNTQRTITELVYVPNDVPDGPYLLEIQLANFDNDASPSRPVLYAIQDEY